MDPLRAGGPDGNYNRVSHRALGLERSLDVFRMDVRPVAGDDHVLLSSPVDEPAFGIAGTDVSGVEPTIVIDSERAPGAGFEVFANDTVSADENFAVIGDPDLLAADHFTQRASSDAERVIHRDHGTRFSESVALDYQQADSAPERLGFGIQRGATDNESPELESERTMGVPVAPPPPQRAAARRRNRSRTRMDSLDVRLKAIEDARDADKHRNSLSPNRLAYRGGVQSPHERCRAAE